MIFFKLKSFPHISETFIDNNILYTLKNKLPITIYTNIFLGIQNSAHYTTLAKNNIEKYLEVPFKFSSNWFKKFFQVFYILNHYRILKYIVPYYSSCKKINLTPLSTLYQYRNLKTGIVHTHFNNALEPIIKLSEIGYIKPTCIITFHGYDAFKENKHTFQLKYKQFYDKHVKAVTVNSIYLQKKVINLGINPKIIKVIPIGIDSSLYKGEVKKINHKGTIHLITVARLIQLKGHIHALKTIAILKNKGYPIKYLIVGAGPEEENLKNEVKLLHLQKEVSFCGYLPQNEIVKLLKESDIFLFPSTYDNENNRREAFGLVSIEAQAMGLPVIGYQSGGFPETIIPHKTGFAVEDRNVEKLANRVAYLIENPIVYESFSNKAIQHAKTFDHKYTTQQYIELYKSL